MAYKPISPSSRLVGENGELLKYIIPYSTKVEVRWDAPTIGTGDSIDYYVLYYRKSSSSTAVVVDKIPGWVYDYEIPQSYINTMARGERLIVSIKVVTIQAQPGYSNQADPLRAVNEPIVNSLPTINSVTTNQNTFYNGECKPVFYFSGNANNTGQELYYYYSYNANGSDKSGLGNVSQSTLYESYKYDGNDYKNFTVYFWVHDGYEMSQSYKAVSTTVFSPMSIPPRTVVTSQVLSYALNGEGYLRTYKISGDINRTSKSYLGQVSGKFNIVSSGGAKTKTINIKSSDYSYFISHDTSSSTGYKILIQIDFPSIISDLEDDWFNQNDKNQFIGLEFFEFYFTINNPDQSLGDIIIDRNNNLSKVFRKFPESIPNSYAKGLLNKKEHLDKYYNDIILDKSILSILEKCSGSIIVKRGVSTNGSSYNYTSINSYTNTQDNSNAQKDAEGAYLKYQITVTDPYGKKTKTYTFSNTLRKLYKPQIENISYTELMELYKPLSFVDNNSSLILQILKSDFYINGKMLSTYKDTDINTFINTWNWNIYLNNYNKDSSELSVAEVTNEPSSIWIKIFNVDLINEIKTFYNTEQQDGTYTLRLKISVTDEYGLSSNIFYTSNFLNIDFRENPEFSGTGNLQIKHILLTDSSNTEPNSTNWTNATIIEPPESSTKYSSKQMVNPNEWIQIIGPKVVDKNIDAGADSREHLTYALTRTNIDNGITETILRQSGYADVFKYAFKSSNYYSNIIKYKYTLKVEDRYGLSNQCTSGFKTDCDLIACPTNSLNDLSNIINFTSTKKDGDNNDYNIITSIKFKNDLFGYDGYSNYKNAERNEYTPLFNIYLYYATDINTLNSYKINPSNSDNRKTIKTFNSSDSLFTTVTSETFSFPIETTTYFMVSTEFSTGLKKDGNPNYIYSFSKTYIVDPSAPTVAIRKNYLGINTNEADLTNDTLLKVKVLESNSEKVKIYLTGTQSTGSGTEITIDLSNGSIDGAIINGGTW